MWHVSRLSVARIHHELDFMADDIVLSIRDLSKHYNLGQVSTGTLVHDVNRWMHRMLGHQDPYEKVGEHTQSSADGRAGRVQALQGVSFDVERGDVVGIIGGNGAGKSTLLKILSRVTAPSSGQAHVKGRIASLLEVGTGFHPELTGEENIFLNGAMMGMTTRETRGRLDEIVAFSGIEPFLQTPVKRYSSGMYVKLAFAVAAHLDADILIIDEVLAVGDAEFQKKCLGKMQSVARTGRTVLFVTHGMDSVRRLCNRAIWLEKGRVLQDSTDATAVVQEYLRKSVSSTGETEWLSQEPKNGRALLQPRRLALTGDDGAPLRLPVPNTQAINIEIDAISYDPENISHLGVVVSTEDGTVVFQSFYGDTAPETWPRLHNEFRLIMRLPPRYLNAGRYTVELASGTPLEWIHKPGFGNPSVNLEIQGGLSDSPRWRGRRPGVLAPVFQWHSQFRPPPTPS
jgi:lipopolysaccharide transport system ATP-binding protein